MDSQAVMPLFWWWGIIIFVLLWIVWRRPSSGLVTAYCFQLWMLYWLAPLIHTFPWSELEGTEETFAGFQQATYGLAAFAVGVILLGPALAGAMLPANVPRRPPAGFEPEMDLSKARRYITIGLVAYFIIRPTIGRIPGLNAIPVSASELVITGCCLQAWMTWKTKGRNGVLRVLPQTLMIPIVVLVRQGFMSFGVLSMSTILLFISQFFRPRWLLLVGAVVFGYAGLSVYVAYMHDREDLRNVLWTGQSTWSEKVNAAWHTISSIEPFNPKDPDHLKAIDDRLNQDQIVGTAVENLSNGGEFAHGSSIGDALLAMIPRLLWPGKPVGAGSGALVSKLTGLEFAEGTSVGVGPVLEFYGNFGTPCVIIGFLLVGMVIGALDFCAGLHLRLGNWPWFTTFFLIGISCLNVSGSLVEITSGVMAAVVVTAWVRRNERGAETMQHIPAVAQ